jgi:uncharacterized membrane protein YfcA
MPALDAFHWALAGLCALLAGLTKTGIPGLGILIAPLFAEVLPAKASTGALLPLLIVGDVFAVLYYRRHAVWSHLVRLLPWAAAGIVIGWLLMGRIADAELRPVFGAVILLLLAVGFWRDFAKGKEAPVPTQWWVAAAIGLLAGVITMLVNAAGAILVIYLTAMRLPKEEFLGTGAWYYLILNLIKVPFSASLGLITASSLLLDAALAGGVLLGAVSGVFVARRVPQKAFAVVVLALAAVSAVRMFL